MFKGTNLASAEGEREGEEEGGKQAAEPGWCWWMLQTFLVNSPPLFLLLLGRREFRPLLQKP